MNDYVVRIEKLKKSERNEESSEELANAKKLFLTKDKNLISFSLHLTFVLTENYSLTLVNSSTIHPFGHRILRHSEPEVSPYSCELIPLK